jgi:hypothetical protein
MSRELWVCPLGIPARERWSPGTPQHPVEREKNALRFLAFWVATLPDFCPSSPLISSVSVFGFRVRDLQSQIWAKQTWIWRRYVCCTTAAELSETIGISVPRRHVKRAVGDSRRASNDVASGVAPGDTLIEIFENDPLLSVTASARSVASKYTSIAACAGKPLPATRMGLVGGPNFGETVNVA